MPGVEGSWTFYQIALAVLMVVTGSINTLAAKWADMITPEDCKTVVGDNGGAGKRKFNHPFVQAVGMFIGEFLCLLAYFALRLFQRWKSRRSKDVREDLGDVDSYSLENSPKFNPLIFLPAALCDMCATSIMYVGLNLTNAASFQMLRGAVIIFTGLLSVAFLQMVLHAFKWVGMLSIMMGLVIVGLSDVLKQDTRDMNGVISGDMLIIMAQVISAVQMVYEQKFIVKYNIHPLLAVGLEGLFGMLALSLLLIPFYFIVVPSTFADNPRHVLEDALDAFYQMKICSLVVLALVGTVISIAFFNFAGISITKELNATTRMVLDSVRTFVIWVISLAVFNQAFSYLQVVGFLILLIGMCIYNDILIGPTNVGRLSEHYQVTACRWYYTVPSAEAALGPTGTNYAGSRRNTDDEDILVRNENPAL